MSVNTIIILGFGNGTLSGSVAEVVTLGYIEAAVADTPICVGGVALARQGPSTVVLEKQGISAVSLARVGPSAVVLEKQVLNPGAVALQRSGPSSVELEKC